MVFYCILEAIGNWLGEERPLEEYEDPAEFTPGYCVDAGTYWVQTFKQLVIPHYARFSNVKRGCPTHCNEVKLKSCRRCDCEKMGTRC